MLRRASNNVSEVWHVTRSLTPSWAGTANALEYNLSMQHTTTPRQATAGLPSPTQHPPHPRIIVPPLPMGHWHDHGTAGLTITACGSLVWGGAST